MEIPVEVKDKTKITIEDLLKSHPEGLTIQDIMDKTKLARHTVLARLHKLDGEKKVNMRQINMAKLYSWKEETQEPQLTEKHEITKHNLKVQPIKEEHIITKPKPTATPAKPKPLSDGRRKTEDGKSAGNTKSPQEVSSAQPAVFDMASIKQEIEQELRGKKITKPHAQIKEQRAPITHKVETSKHASGKKPNKYITTGIAGLDELFEQGIPKGSAILIAGGAGSGKTILTLQTVNMHAQHGEKCLYMSFEESEEKLMHHMEDFGWNPEEEIKKGNLLIKRFNPFDITRSVDALLAKAKGELLIDIDPIVLPKNFKPDIIVVDSLTAIASAFTAREDSYRVYIEQLFRFFEKIGATSFLITETQQIPTVFSQTGVEEFLADGVIVLYNFKRGNVRENAIEILKLRGAKHQKKIVAMQVVSGEGIVVYPEQEVFGEM